MSQTENEDSGDAMVDAMGAVAIVVIPVIAVVYFLSGLPS
jgi:hypothetical protein